MSASDDWLTMRTSHALASSPRDCSRRLTGASNDGGGSGRLRPGWLATSESRVATLAPASEGFRPAGEACCQDSSVRAELLEVDLARSRVLDAVTPLRPEDVALDSALGRVLAEDVTSGADLPPF